jgi:hypothetical protein
MSVGGQTPLIWPLLNKQNPTVAAQQRPKSSFNGRMQLVRLPVLPWDCVNRPPVITYGRYDRTPVMWEFAPWNFGAVASGLSQSRLQNFKTNPRSRQYSEALTEPSVVRPIKLPARISTISGVTLDLNSAVLGSCRVELYLTSTDEVLGRTTSDATTGAFSFTVARYSPATHYIVAYKAGGTDVAGTTVNTLTGTG